MKTTLNLPDDLMREVKLRAVEEDRTLTDTIAELLRYSLAEKPSGPATVRNRVSLPLVHGGHSARPSEEMTPERLAEILLAEDAAKVLDAGR